MRGNRGREPGLVGMYAGTNKRVLFVLLTRSTVGRGELKGQVKNCFAKGIPSFETDGNEVRMNEI